MKKSLDELIGPQIERKSPQFDPRFAMRVEGPTPNGGAYSIGFYYDSEGNPCVPEQASTIHIHEYDENDLFINEVVGICNNKGE